MQKKIATSELRIGMHIVRLDGNWINHPFWKTAFKLSEAKDLNAIRDSGITHVWIDTSKGDDIDPVGAPMIEAGNKPEAKTECRVKRTSLEDEVETARETLGQARVAMGLE